MVSSSSLSDTLSGIEISRLSMPTSPADLILPLTYDWLAGFSPTSITVSTGTLPYCPRSDTTRSAIPAFSREESSFPSIIIIFPVFYDLNI